MSKSELSTIKLHALPDENDVVQFIFQGLDLDEDSVVFHQNGNREAEYMLANASSYIFKRSTEGLRDWNQIGHITLSNSQKPRHHILTFTGNEGLGLPILDKEYSEREFEMYLDFEGVVFGELLKAGFFKDLFAKYSKETSEQ